MAVKYFYLLGDSSSAKATEFNSSTTLDQLNRLVAANFAIVEAHGINLHCENVLTSISEVLSTGRSIAISVNGRAVRDVPGPKGLPYIGNYLEVYPDHLGNHQRLFNTFGPIFRTHSFGRRVYYTNDPHLSTIVFIESDFFTKKINEAHPLYGIKNNDAGIFIGDTETEAWKTAHRLFPPVFAPKAVRHYAPVMEAISEQSFRVFDLLDAEGRAWNVYHYMLKLACQLIGQLVLGMDLGHFDSVGAPLHELVTLFGKTLHLNKKVTSWGDWYAMLPFGNPRKLRQVRHYLDSLIEQAINSARRGGMEDLKLADAALKAANVVDYAVRATNSRGQKLTGNNLVQGLEVIVGAGFTTSSSLLSWLVYSLVAYPGMQERLLQELIDNNIGSDTTITAEILANLTLLDKFVKETQRRHNPSYQPARTAKVDLILPGGLRIPRDSVVIPALHHTHNNPTIWDNPTHFNPDRWDTEQVKQRHKGAYTPFAAGPRMCIGYNFALQEAKIVIVKLLYRYEFSREGDDAVEYDPLHQTVVPTNLYVRAERRSRWPSKTMDSNV